MRLKETQSFRLICSKVDERKNGRHEDVKTTQPRNNRRKGLTTRSKGQQCPEEDDTMTQTKDTTTSKTRNRRYER